MFEFDEVDISNLNIIRFGLHLGYFEKNRFIPSHSISMSNKIDHSKFIELTKEEPTDYLQGLEIHKETSFIKGYAIASYEGLALGFVKVVNNTLKNHLPKGLRVSRNLIK